MVHLQEQVRFSSKGLGTLDRRFCQGGCQQLGGGLGFHLTEQEEGQKEELRGKSKTSVSDSEQVCGLGV